MARLTIRIDLPPAGQIGPGKAKLLELIGETGSISAAGRALDMSYRRAWLLVDAMNHIFKEPVVSTMLGGKAGGGARLTPVRQGSAAAITAGSRPRRRRPARRSSSRSNPPSPSPARRLARSPTTPTRRSKNRNPGQARRKARGDTGADRARPAMDPVGKALWYIENNLGGELTLAKIAAAAGMSRFHLLRAFGAATGSSIMEYARRRRLSEAAKLLTAGAADILGVALDHGYASHEAFTRAFRDQFGITPETARTQGDACNLQLTEAIAMENNLVVELAPPRFEDGRAMLIAGLGERYTFETNKGIPFQWQRFSPYIGNIPGQVGRDHLRPVLQRRRTGPFRLCLRRRSVELRRPAAGVAARPRPGAALCRVHP